MKKVLEMEITSWILCLICNGEKSYYGRSCIREITTLVKLAARCNMLTGLGYCSG
jgi:hypothetical protein